jgi:hypothetical protein
VETLGYIHFFSWETRVSIELPVGFEEEAEDPDTNSAIYTDGLDEPEDSDKIAARVLTKMTAVPPGSTDAYRAIAKESEGISSRSVESREEIVVDGAPAIRQILRYREEELGIEVFRHETFAQLADVVFSITCLAPADQSGEYRPAFDHGSDTARFILLPASEATVSLAHGGLRISALLPETWELSEVADNHLRFFGSAHPEHDGYRSTFSIKLGEPGGFGAEWFQAFSDASLSNLRKDFPGFELRSIERFTLSSLVDVQAVWYSWESESGHAFTQLQALGLMDRYHLYLINAATLSRLSEKYLPIFDDVLRSLRMLPSLP